MQILQSKRPPAFALAAVWQSPYEATDSYDRLKRAFDITVAGLALTLCLPLLIVACVLIALDLNSTPIYKQKRVGMGGRTFEIYKLRTMIPGTESFSFKTEKDDWRVTLLGHLLRSTKIDELPQLVNILSGEMSIIGPRPLSVAECEHIVSSGIEPQCPGFFPHVRPGLIGLEQMNRESHLDYRQRFALNYQYETNKSLDLDLSIFLRSIWICRQVCMATVLAGMSELAFVAWFGT